MARNHRKLLQQHRHVRYMWFPYTDAVIVVTNDPVKEVRLVCAPVLQLAPCLEYHVSSALAHQLWLVCSKSNGRQ